MPDAGHRLLILIARNEDAFDPLVTTDSSVGIATQAGEAGDARLRELVDQMRKLQVPVAKQIDVIISLRLSGSLLNVDVWEVVE